MSGRTVPAPVVVPLRPARPAEHPALDVLGTPLDGIRLVEASAGTGKTWAICGLYLRLLLERRLSVEQILVVTFTNAATAELRERIRARLVELLAVLDGGEGGPSHARELIERCTGCGIEAAELRSRVELALQSFDQAAIHTIHGFCQRALADAPFTARLPLALELVPDDSPLIAEVVSDFWRRRLAGDGVSAELVALLELRRDAPARWAQLLRRHLGRPLARSIWPPGIEADEPVDSAALASRFAAAGELWSAGRDEIVACIEDSPSLHKRRYPSGAAALGAREWDALFEAGPLALALPREKAALYRRSILVHCTRKQQATPGHAFFDAAEALFAEHERLGRALELQRLRLLREMLETGCRALAERKRALRRISFDDLLSQLHERLASGEGEGLRSALRARFPAALIDEFQDTDPLQWAIFEAIYGSATAGPGLSLFLVGDPKQAIYSFRHADLHTYLQARSRAQASYSLADNQRSSPALITAINGVFAANRDAFRLPGLDYPRVRFGARPRPPFVDRSQPDAAALQVWLLPRAEGEPLAKKAAAEAAVGATAAEIARLLGEAAAGRVQLDGRPLGAGDIAVLVRTHAQGLAMRLALAAVGLGCVELSQTSVFATPEAEALERLLAAILEPGHGGLLRAAFASELLGDDAAAVASLADDEARLLARTERLAGYRAVWQRRGIGVMLRQLARAEGIERRLLPRSDGERRLTNLRHLGELLHQAAETQRAPQALLRWLRAQRRSDSVDEVAQMRLESDRHLVQIVTVHRAKGLEYPVVFCPFLYDGGLPPGDEGLDGWVCRDEDDQVVIDWRVRLLDRDEVDRARQRRRDEAATEQLRLSYVALTRAVHRCVLVGGAYAVRRSSRESLRSPLAWLVAGDGAAPADWPPEGFTADALDHAWRALAEQVGPAAMSVEPLPSATAPRMVAAAGATRLTLPAAPQAIPEGWRIGSYSALMRGAGERGAEAAAEPPPDAAPAAPAASARRGRAAVGGDDILDFPRGPEAGDCLHAVLQSVDLADPAGWRPAIDAALQAHPLMAARRRTPAEMQARWPAMIERLLADLAHSELIPGLRLAGVPPSRRMAEFGFTVGSRRLDSGALQRLLEGEGYALPPLAATTLDGYLTGSIDWVFEHGGRHYLIDWKSNHLGNSPADYRRPALEAAMAGHGYHLQQLIYAVALQRHLRRCIAGYDGERDFGGVLYLFLRGIRPGAGATGVWFHQPRPAVLDALDALLKDGPAAAAAGGQYDLDLQ